MNSSNGKTVDNVKGRIRIGALISHDHSHSRWPECRFSNNTFKVIHPGGDTQIIRIDQAFRACNLVCEMKDFLRQKNDFEALLLNWLNTSSKGKVDCAYLAVKDNGLLFAVVCNTEEYDFELGSLLSELEWRIAGDDTFSEFKFNTRALPVMLENSFLTKFVDNTPKHHKIDPNMIFDVKWINTWWECKADGFGKEGNYGSGSILVHDYEDIDLFT